MVAQELSISSIRRQIAAARQALRDVDVDLSRIEQRVKNGPLARSRPEWVVIEDGEERWVT